MTGGRREREYTPEEAMAITLNEVTPHWYRSDPLVVGVNLSDKSYPQPLDPRVLSGTWVFFFVSATSPSFEQMIQIQKLWEKRYSGLGIEFVLAFRGHYSFFNERKIISHWINSLPIQSIAYCDVTGALAKSFGSEGEPGIAILHEGRVAYSASGRFSITDAERNLHSILREASPGIPFWPPIADADRVLRSTDRWVLFNNSKSILSNQVQLIGNWEFYDDRIVTADSKAELSFRSPGSSVDMVARSLSDAGDPTRVRFDTNGASFSDAYAGKDLAVDDEGNSSVVLGGPRSYFLLRNLPESLRSLRFRFPFAKVSPVAIYGFEFGELLTLKDL